MCIFLCLHACYVFCSFSSRSMNHSTPLCVILSSILSFFAHRPWCLCVAHVSCLILQHLFYYFYIYCPLAEYTCVLLLSTLVCSFWVHFFPLAEYTCVLLLSTLVSSCWVHLCALTEYICVLLLSTLVSTSWVHLCPSFLPEHGDKAYFQNVCNQTMDKVQLRWHSTNKNNVSCKNDRLCFSKVVVYPVEEFVVFPLPAPKVNFLPTCWGR